MHISRMKDFQDLFFFQCTEQSLEGEVSADWSVRAAGTGNEGILGKEGSQTHTGA